MGILIMLRNGISVQFLIIVNKIDLYYLKDNYI